LKRHLIANTFYKPLQDLLNGLGDTPATKTAAQLASQTLSEACRKHA